MTPEELRRLADEIEARIGARLRTADDVVVFLRHCAWEREELDAPRATAVERALVLQAGSVLAREVLALRARLAKLEGVAQRAREVLHDTDRIHASTSESLLHETARDILGEED